MDELLSIFNAIESRADIDKIIKEASSPDGEYSWFEMKGTAEKVKIDRDLKKLFAKEISAFANTYGGVLCIHKGKDTEIKPFEPLEINDLHNCVETWLRDSLEPRSQGMILKECSGLFLVLIPESRTKPHRSAVDKLYYYRHNTQSETMSELMISAMYRSQDHLAMRASVVLHKSFGQSLSFTLVLNNESMIAGTKPRATIQIFSSQTDRLKISPDKHLASSMSETLFRPFRSVPSLYPNCEIATTDKFQDRILYPKDLYFLNCNLLSSVDINTWQARFFLVRVDCFFLETTRQVRYFLIDVEQKPSEGNGLKNLIATGSENDEMEIIANYMSAIASN
jgi:hypothetical protein